MPYYSELGLYTMPTTNLQTSTNFYVPGPYSNHSSIIASNFVRPPSTTVTSRNFRNYKPHLATISENQAHLLRRVNSPKLIITTTRPTATSKRPIKINTADIDVSINKYNNNRKYERPTTKQIEEEATVVKEAKPNAIIKRDRATIRIQTIHRDLITKSWRDNFEQDELKSKDLLDEEKKKKRPRKTQGELLKEKFLIRNKNENEQQQNNLNTKLKRGSIKKVGSNTSINNISGANNSNHNIQKTPSFHDICTAITSNKITTDEELNPGQPIEIHRRQSRQLSTEDLINELQRSPSATKNEQLFLLEMINEDSNNNNMLQQQQRASVKKKKKLTKKKSNEKLILTTNNEDDDEDDNNNNNNAKLQRRNTQKKSTTKQKEEEHEIKDISAQVEIEKIKTKRKPIITVGNVDIDPKPVIQLKAIIDDDVKVEETQSIVPKKPANKLKFNVTVETIVEKQPIRYHKQIKTDGTLQIPGMQRKVVTKLMKPTQKVHFGQILDDIKEKPTNNKKHIDKEIIDMDLAKSVMKKGSDKKKNESIKKKLEQSKSEDHNSSNTDDTQLRKTKSTETMMPVDKNNENKCWHNIDQIRSDDSIVSNNNSAPIKLPTKRSLVNKANKDDPDMEVFESPPTPPVVVQEEGGFVPLQSNRLSQFMHPFKKPEQYNECPVEIYARPKTIRKRHYPRPRHPPIIPPAVETRQSDGNSSRDDDDDDEDSSSSSSDEESTTSSSSSSSSSSGEEENEDDLNVIYKVGASTSSNDSGFDSAVTGSKNKDCDVNCHKKCEKLTANLCGVNQKLIVEAIESVRKGGSTSEARDSTQTSATASLSNPAFAIHDSSSTTCTGNNNNDDYSQSSTYVGFQKSGRITPPATTIPRFRKYCVEDFNFLKVLGKGSFGKVLLAELRNTEYYYAIKCLKKDVVLEDDDVECTLIERKVLALGTKHPYLCHLLCTFQTESHLFFVMEYLNGGDLMFHIQQSGRFSEARAKFYGAEIVSGLKFLHTKGIVYRDLKLDNILLDFDGHVRIADFGMCKLQIFLDRMADTFCGTPDYMAPEIIKGLHYNQCVDWWSFGVLLYEMLIGQSPFSGCDEDELFWSICNEKPVIPRFLSTEASAIVLLFLEKDATKRLGNRFCPSGDIQDQPFFRQIDWNMLEARQLEAPFKPNLKHPLDTQYFDRTFTVEKAKLTPIEHNILQSMDQTQFQGFSYTNPNATDK